MLALLLVAIARDAADRHAGIEIGGSGVKVTVVEARPDGLIRRVFGASRKTALAVLLTVAAASDIATNARGSVPHQNRAGSSRALQTRSSNPN